MYADRSEYARISGLSEAALNSLLTESQADPDVSVLSTCIDGMDQSKFKLPRNIKNSKMWDRLWRPQAHVTGCIVHGGKEFYYLNDQDPKKDSNNNCELLARTLDVMDHDFPQKVMG